VPTRYALRVTESDDVQVRRLGARDRELARVTFDLLADVFGEKRDFLTDAYLDELLGRPWFLVFAATDGGHAVGGLTAHMLPMTAYQGAEIFIYDVAVVDNYQRRGVGRRLLGAVRDEASRLGTSSVFVLADNEDAGALAFYRTLGGVANGVTLFGFDPTES
jgi:aminoglycoside 3-N-acetyltransferase I